jgi:hypothetical protein
MAKYEYWQQVLAGNSVRHIAIAGFDTYCFIYFIYVILIQVNGIVRVFTISKVEVENIHVHLPSPKPEMMEVYS